MDPPFGRVPEQGLDRFLVATEACCGETPDWFLSGSLGTYRRSWHRSLVKGPHRGSMRQGARPPPSWGPRESPTVTLCSSIFYNFQKKSPLIFRAFRELLFLHKNNTIVVLLKTASVRVSSNEIIPKACKNVINMT